MSDLNSSRVPVDHAPHHSAMRVFGLSIARELKTQGYEIHDVITLAGELIEIACESIRSSHAPASEIAASDPVRRGHATIGAPSAG